MAMAMRMATAVALAMSDARAYLSRTATAEGQPMTERKFETKPLAVPSSRISRFAKLSGLGANIAGSVAAEGAKQLARGQRPNMGALLMTPANARKVADKLAQMRGAAMKVGQLMSMDAGDMLPPELADILARLRAEAHHMPGQQLKKVLTTAWGSDWLKRFKKFEVRPLAAASIGQVHRAQTRDGRDLAIKVQYPGVRRSIDSDVDNVAGLMRFAGLVPKGLDITPMILEAKRQLHEEADYEREGEYLDLFGKLLKDRPEFRVPELHADFTTREVLAMSYIEAKPIEVLEDASQEERNRVMRLIIELIFDELFVFRLMQTDPNFANFRYDPETGQIILLDFGATRAFDEDFAERYRTLLRAGLADDHVGIRAAAREIGFLSEDMPEALEDQMLSMFLMSLEPLRHDGEFDFGANDLALRMRDAGMAMSEQREHMRIPPMDTLFLQRKFGGVYLLATKMGARINLRELIQKHI
ncbi:putative unusual protein kinase regulating ubiquinone biosynthesis (AarF/ABC1/UbiB family) [Rhodobacter aestuarii]|uniref:Predicted unusual protein kinase regulating ubiquinone biosynthesis, AarF/ABC1/UbiB family n=2 Tax=Rhodobacter aestuarii TaxID=453582 RepID=A0A1N7MMD6_9RHOB|nr:putative unusual protein kinase regulating ubiquinone biosynthesis (AarF/ABC1/UbiB family) [Rhodobacter aestuarii]SIS87099.1 Predicted unusual protein kinase regulating ubiquinone biosynthesis, AarF/ABC1/UbiB family [Rhodobacter aestuarii]